MPKKRPKDKVEIPVDILQDRSLSVLESIVRYLKENKNLRYSEIAKLLNRDDRTIWTAYNRAKKKAGLKNLIILIGAVIFFFSLFGGNASAAACGDTITASTTLTSNLKNSTSGKICPGTGLTIGASDITLNCNNFNITGDGNLTASAIVIDGYNNININNCNLYTFGDNNIYISNANNISFKNVTVVTADVSSTISAFYLTNTVSNITINKANVNVTGSSERDGITFEFASGSNLTLTNSSITGQRYAVNLGGSDKGLFKNNNLTGRTSIAVNMLSNSDNNRFENNNIQTPYTARVINLVGNNNTFINNTINGSGTSSQNAVYLSSSDNNNFTGNTMITSRTSFHDTAGSLLYLTASAGNIFDNNTLTNPNQHGIYITGSAAANNTFTSNTINTSTNSTSAYNIKILSSADNNTFTGNTLYGNGINMSGAGNSTFTNTTFYNTNTTIRFNSFTVSDGNLDTQGNIILSLNYTSVNSTAVPELNTSARITMNNLNFNKPKVIVDYDGDGLYDDCRDCTVVSSGPSEIFDVTHFTAFAVTENNLYCSIFNRTQVPSGYASLFNMYQETNSHVQNVTYTGYNYTIACTNNTAHLTLGNSCSGNYVNVTQLFQQNNSHVSIDHEYSLDICMNATAGTTLNLTTSAANPDAAKFQCIFDVYQYNNSHAASCGSGNYGVFLSIGNIPNTAPNVTAPVITPSTAYGNTDLTANTTYNDSDGDSGTVYFRWYVNNINIYNQTNTSISDKTVVTASLDSANFTSGDQVNLSVYASDGTDNSSTLWSNTITIQNQIPAQGTPILNATDSPSNLTTANLTVYAQNVVDDDPVKNITDWRLNGRSIAILNLQFDGGSNSTFTKDYTTYSNNASVNNAVWNSTGGYDGFGSYEFDGDSDWINASSVLGELDETKGTITMWVKVNIIGTNPALYSARSAGYFETYLSGSSLYYRYGDSSNSISSPIQLDSWQFWAFTWDNSSGAKIYRDGSENASFAGSWAAQNFTGNFRLGMLDAAVTQTFNGSMDDVRIYDRVLSPEEITALYQNKTDTIVSNETNIWENWKACLTPNDGTAEGAAKCSNTLKIESGNDIPTVTLISPSNNSAANSPNTTFVYNVTDNDGIENCSLIINSVLNSTDNTITKNIDQNFSLFLINTTYNWSVNCTDNNTYTETGSSDTWNVSITSKMGISETLNPAAASANSTVVVSGRVNFTDGTVVPDTAVNIYLNGTAPTFSLSDFGEGTDGSLTVTSPNTIINNYTHVTDNISSGALEISVADASAFNADDLILIIQMQNYSAGIAGQYEFDVVSSVNGSNLSLKISTDNAYYSGVFNTSNSTVTQVIRVPQYTNLTIAGGGSLTAKAWDGYSGGILIAWADDKINITGSINLSGKGYRGGRAPSTVYTGGEQGESITGRGIRETSSTTDDPNSNSSNIGGGGGGDSLDNAGDNVGGGGGGASYGSNGTRCTYTAYDSVCGDYGDIYGDNTLAQLHLGSGGGAGGTEDNGVNAAGSGGNGAGAVFLYSPNINLSGSIIANGNDGADGASEDGGGGGGSGGSVYLRAQTVDIGTDKLNSSGGMGGLPGYGSDYGGDGGKGRFRIDYTSLSGSISNTTYGSYHNGTFTVISVGETVKTNTTGYYTYNLTAPSSSGIYPITVNLTYRGYFAENTTNLTVGPTNNPPTAPILLLPADNSTTTNRTPQLLWNNSNDTDGDTLTYQILLDNDSTFSSPIINVTGIVEGTSNTTYNITSPLDVDTTFYWKVRADDGTANGSYSNVSNFTVQSYVAISLIRNSVDFGTINTSSSDDTTDNNPLPFLLENQGNIKVNITITGTKWFDSVAFPSEYYQFKVDYNESGAFNLTASTNSWTNMTNLSSNKDIIDLDWNNSKNTVETDIKVNITESESLGPKSSNVTFNVI